MSLKQRLLGILKQLGDENFKEFKWYLESNGSIPTCSLEAATRLQTVDLIAHTYPNTAVEVTITLLEKIKRHDLAEKLSDAGPGGSGASVTQTMTKTQEDKSAGDIVGQLDASLGKRLHQAAPADKRLTTHNNGFTGAAGSMTVSESNPAFNVNYNVIYNTVAASNERSGIPLPNLAKALAAEHSMTKKQVKLSTKRMENKSIIVQAKNNGTPSYKVANGKNSVKKHDAAKKLKAAEKSPKRVKKPAAKKPAVEKPAVEKPAVEKPAAKKPAVKKPAVKKPAAKKPAVKKPAVKKPAAKKPAVKKPAVKKPAVKKPAVKKPAAKKPAVKKPAVKKPAVKKPAIKKPKIPKKAPAKNKAQPKAVKPRKATSKKK